MTMLQAFSKRKRWAGLLAAAVLPFAVALSGCGESKTPSKSAPEQNGAPQSSGPATSPPPSPSTSPPPPATVPKPVPEATPPPPPPPPPPPATVPPPAPAPRAEAPPPAPVPTAPPVTAPSVPEPAGAVPPPAPAIPPDKAPGGGLGMSGTGTGGGGEETGTSRGIGTQPASPAAASADAAFDVVPVYFGTDRVQEPGTARLNFGSERAHKLQLGRALVTVPTAHKVPHIERPWVIELPYFKYKIYEQKEDPAKHFTVQEIASLSKDQLLAQVRERLAKSSAFKDHAIVFVHGFNTSFDAALYRTAQISYDLKFDGAPFVYSWPSGGKVASYTYDRGSAEQAEPHLAEFLSMVVKESGAKSISLIAHSMGNELLLRVLERMRPSTPKGVVISQVILAAPDVDRDKFANIAREITSFAKGVTLYAASNDRALGYSARFWGGVPRAGDVPASGPLIVPGVDTIDVTAVSTDGLGLNHSGYAENPKLLDDVKALIQAGIRPPDKRIKDILKVESPGGVFWRYPPVAK